MAKKPSSSGGRRGGSSGSGGDRAPGASDGAPNGEEGGSTRDWWRVHLWQVQPVRDVLVIAGIIGLIYLGKVLSIVTVPLLLALALSYLFEPVVKRLLRIDGMKRTTAVAAIMGMVVAVIAVPATLGIAFAVAQGANTVDRIARGVSAVQASLDEPENEDLQRQVRRLGPPWWSVREFLLDEPRDLAPPEGEGQPEEDAGPTVDEPSAAYRLANLVLVWAQANSAALADKLYGTGRGAVGVALSTIASFGKLLFMLFLTAFFFYFLSTGYPKVVEFGKKLIPERHNEMIVDLLTKFDRVIAGFIRGRITIAAIQAIVFTVLFWFIGVPVPLIIGPVVAILSIVPYVALVGVPIAIIGLWLDPSGPLPSSLTSSWVYILVAPVVVYFAGQALDDYVWTPAIQGKATDMDTPTILFASIAGGTLMGMYGLLLAIPVAACLKILIREIFWPRFKAWSEGKEKDFLPFGRG